MKRFLILFTAVLILLIAFLAFLFIEDGRYAQYEFKPASDNNKRALLLTWSADDPSGFWGEYESVHAMLKALHDSGEIDSVLPFRHEVLKHPDADADWNMSAIVMFSPRADVDALSEQILDAVQSGPVAGGFRAADIMKLQKGLDLLYPVKNGPSREDALMQTIEYVFSDPASRVQYYNDQYVWSGPAMADLHSRDKTGRFIGFEVEKRIHSAPGAPEWDLVHVYGFTWWQLVKSIPFFTSTWNKHAVRAFGGDATFKGKLREWDEIRLKVESSAVQNMNFTLQIQN